MDTHSECQKNLQILQHVYVCVYESSCPCHLSIRNRAVTLLLNRSERINMAQWVESAGALVTVAVPSTNSTGRGFGRLAWLAGPAQSDSVGAGGQPVS